MASRSGPARNLTGWTGGGVQRDIINAVEHSETAAGTQNARRVSSPEGAPRRRASELPTFQTATIVIAIVVKAHDAAHNAPLKSQMVELATSKGLFSASLLDIGTLCPTLSR